jgi:hypothetical protein
MMKPSVFLSMVVCAFILGGGTALTLSSCSHITPVEQALLDCGSSAVEQQIPTLVPQVNSILSSGSVNWQDALNALLSTAGSAVICAVQVAINALEATPGPSNGQIAAIARGEAWLTAHPGLTTGSAVRPPGPNGTITLSPVRH